MTYKYDRYHLSLIEEILTQAQEMASSCGVSTEAVLTAMEVYEAKRANQSLSYIDSKTEEVHDAIQAIEQILDKED